MNIFKTDNAETIHFSCPLLRHNHYHEDDIFAELGIFNTEIAESDKLKRKMQIHPKKNTNRRISPFLEGREVKNDENRLKQNWVFRKRRPQNSAKLENLKTERAESGKKQQKKNRKSHF